MSENGAMSKATQPTNFEGFVRTIAHLRAPDGCPWDREQTHTSIAHNMIEEAYEAVDAIERGDMLDLREELGDVLLQVVMHSRMAEEAGEFSIADVIGDVNEKMIRRHPHVFGNEAAFAAAHLSDEQIAQIRGASTPDKVLELWDQVKIIEKQKKAERRALTSTVEMGATSAAPSEVPDAARADMPEVSAELHCSGSATSNHISSGVGLLDSIPSSGVGLLDSTLSSGVGLLDSIPKSLPALMQAQDISRKAVAAGFEWPDLPSVWEQVYSELEEYRAEDKGSTRAEEEFGDLLFSLINVARKEGIDAESGLRASCRKFRARWAIMEHDAKMDGKHISSYSLDELEELWSKAKVRLARRD